MRHTSKATAITWNEVLNKIWTGNDEKIPLIVTFNRTLLDLRHLIYKNCHILQIEPKLKNFFKNPTVVAIKRNKNLHNFIGGNKLYNNEKLKHGKSFDTGKCHSRAINLGYKQLIPNIMFSNCNLEKSI